MPATPFEQATMRAALGLARRGLGRVAPNPSVACIILKDGRVVARGRTGEGGRPHGEAVALAQAGSEARGATQALLETARLHGDSQILNAAESIARYVELAAGGGGSACPLSVVTPRYRWVPWWVNRPAR